KSTSPRPHSRSCGRSNPISPLPGLRPSYPGRKTSIASITWKAFAAPASNRAAQTLALGPGITAAFPGTIAVPAKLNLRFTQGMPTATNPGAAAETSATAPTPIIPGNRGCARLSAPGLELIDDSERVLALRRCGSARVDFGRNGVLGRKPVDQRQPIQAFAEPPREIIFPALGAQSPLLPDLRHGQAVNEDIMHQRRAVGAEFALGAVQPQHRFALAFRDRLK